MIIAVAMSIALVLLTTGVHLAFFCVIVRSGNPRARISDLRFYYLMLGIFAVHLVDIGLAESGRSGSGTQEPLG